MFKQTQGDVAQDIPGDLGTDLPHQRHARDAKIDAVQP